MEEIRVDVHRNVCAVVYQWRMGDSDFSFYKFYPEDGDQASATRDGKSLARDNLFWPPGTTEQEVRAIKKPADGRNAYDRSDGTHYMVQNCDPAPYLAHPAEPPRDDQACEASASAPMNRARSNF